MRPVSCLPPLGPAACGPRRSEAGFTLAEAMLVLVIGAIMLGGATLLYTELRNSAASALAREKIATLQGLIEKYQAADSGTYPSGQELADELAQARSSDWANSPWGGMAQCISSGAGTAGTTCETPDGQSSGYALRWVAVDGSTQNKVQGGPQGQVPQIAGDGGVLDYFSFAPDMLANGNYPYLAVYDHNLGMYDFTSSYAVAIEDPSGNEFYFVRGPGFCPNSVCWGPAPASQVSNMMGPYGCVGCAPKFEQ